MKRKKRRTTMATKIVLLSLTLLCCLWIVLLRLEGIKLGLVSLRDSLWLLVACSIVFCVSIGLFALSVIASRIRPVSSEDLPSKTSLSALAETHDNAMQPSRSAQKTQWYETEDAPIETTATPPNRFEVLFSLIQPDGREPGSTRLIGRVSRGAIKAWEPARLVNPHGNQFDTEVIDIAIVCSRERRPHHAAATPGDLYDVRIDGLFPNLPHDCDSETLLVRTANRPSQLWKLNGLHSQSKRSDKSSRGLSARQAEHVVMCFNDANWGVILTKHRLLYVRLYPPGGKEFYPGAAPPWRAQRAYERAANIYMPILHRAEDLIEQGHWPKLFSGFCAQEVAANGSPIKIARISPDKIVLDIAGLVFVPQRGTWPADFPDTLASQVTTWRGNALQSKNNGEWELREDTSLTATDSSEGDVADTLKNQLPTACIYLLSDS